MGHNKEGQTWKGTAIPKAWLKSCWRRGAGSPLSRGEVCWFAQASMGVQSPSRQATTLQGTDEPRLGGKWTEGVGAPWVLNPMSVRGEGCGKVATGSRPGMQGHQ